MLNFQSSALHQFIQQIASRFNSTTSAPTFQSKARYQTSLYSIDSANQDDQDDFRYAPSSIYSADSFCSSQSLTITSTRSTTTESVFEKTYVSFPDYMPSTTSNRALFTKPEVMTATATPSFYNTPHSKPIWIA
ncbi:hypothetical protein [Parasitella parasitica]|uniref:Uncharacterized protein n=1 Tax=Parasitella parasitica TaxID=35722 RepID=A0A0B7NAI6_9FUNG|nr:hypothetical protein [Parasitella parasitica]